MAIDAGAMRIALEWGGQCGGERGHVRCGHVSAWMGSDGRGRAGQPARAVYSAGWAGSAGACARGLSGQRGAVCSVLDASRRGELTPT